MPEERDSSRRAARDRIIGIDGEGQGRRPHRYNYLAAADELGASWNVSAAHSTGRLTTTQCLDFILGLPARALIFGFAFTYDLTKILQDLDDRNLFNLFHEERRVVFIGGRVQYKPVNWEGYRLNFINRRFSVQYGKQRRTVWDIWRFFQSKFTTALIDWQVADKTLLERMARMKDLRSVLDKLPFDEIKEYCNEECRYLASLGRKLIVAHDNAGLTLPHYYGAGSTASAFLEKLGIREKRGEIPDGMRQPVACGFIGGRFENSVVGPIDVPVWNYDIASAYPYQATFLPCLQHGVWRLVRSDSQLGMAQLALVHWSISGNQADSRTAAKNQADCAWGVLPHRSAKGTICWPLASEGGGWVWKQEFLAARKLRPHINFREAWVYETDCHCEPPFATVPEYYRERFRLGKDAAGIPIKLGLNSGTYGKLAQSTGIDPPYQSWVWAGNVTSGCRAQLLDAIGLAKDPWNVLMFATDGVWSREKLDFPLPRETGTSDLVKPDGQPAGLGSWEEKHFPAGVFCVRPGIYFPLGLPRDPKDEPTEKVLKELRSRGLGKKVLYERWPDIVDAWNRGDEKLHFGGISRFIGAKSSITRAPSTRTYTRSPDYGEWIEWGVNVSFDPQPKRSHRDGERLIPWQHFETESAPYDRAMLDPEAKMLKIAEIIAEEQPDADWTSYE